MLSRLSSRFLDTPLPTYNSSGGVQWQLHTNDTVWAGLPSAVGRHNERKEPYHRALSSIFHLTDDRLIPKCRFAGKDSLAVSNVKQSNRSAPLHDFLVMPRPVSINAIVDRGLVEKISLPSWTYSDS